MSHMISFDDGDVLDIDTTEGAKKYVQRFLNEKGASSRIWAALDKYTDNSRTAASLRRLMNDVGAANCSDLPECETKMCITKLRIYWREAVSSGATDKGFVEWIDSIAGEG